MCFHCIYSALLGNRQIIVSGTTKLLYQGSKTACIFLDLLLQICYLIIKQLAARSQERHTEPGSYNFFHFCGNSFIFQLKFMTLRCRKEAFALDIRQLRYFLRICSDGSILKASQNVFITQQALSKIISAMEQEIGAPLFFRSSRGLVPTEIGLQLKKLAQPVVDAMDKLNEEISSAVQLQSNNLSLGVSCGLQYFLPQAGLREFSQTHPDIFAFH